VFLCSRNITAQTPSTQLVGTCHLLPPPLKHTHTQYDLAASHRCCPLLPPFLPSGLFRGFVITLARDTPSYGLYFCLYHWTVAAAAAGLAALPGTPLGLTDSDGQHLPAQQQQQQKQQQHGMQPSLSADMLPADGSCSNGRCPSAEAAALAYASSPAVQFVAGGVAGALAWASIYPIDVVKSRVQAAPAHRVAASRVGAWQQGAALIAAEGWAGFSRGLGATMARGFIVNAAIFASFEALQQSLAPM
jgi:Mitochondrial carrier protein